MLPWRSTGESMFSVPAHCEPQTPFLHWYSATFSTCVPTPLALTTTLLGTLSCLAWLFAQLPQIYKNHKIKSTAGLSIYFLVEWLLGDTTNLVGAILTNQASWQITIASYYTFVDIILVCQFTYYTKYLSRQKKKEREVTHARDDAWRRGPGGSVLGEHTAPRPIDKPRGASGVNGDENKSPFGSFNFPGFSMSPREKVLGKRYTRVPTQGSPSASPRTVLVLAMFLAVVARAAPTSLQQATVATSVEESDKAELAGRIVSWISTFMYLASRLPQIFKNARRRSTAGLSISLFIAAFFGNLFYSTSLLTNPQAWGSYPPHGYFGWVGEDGSDRRTWVLLALPFWLGAAGVLSLDLTIGVQFLMYGDGEQPVITVAEARSPVPAGDDGVRGRPRSIRRVSGWMRGWIPSPSGMSWRTSSMTSQSSRLRFGRSTEEDEDRPLLAGNDQRPASPLRNAYGTT